MQSEARQRNLSHTLALCAAYWILLQLSFARGYGFSAEALLIPGLAALTVFLPWRLAALCRFLLAGWMLGLLLYFVADSGLQRFFARSLELKYDLYLLPNLWDLLWDSASPPMAVAILLSVIGLLGSTSLLFARLLRSASKALSAVPALAAWWGVALLVLLVASPPTHSLHILRGVEQAALIAKVDDEIERKLLAAVRSEVGLPTDLSRLAGDDFLLFFVESYGRVLWDDPLFRADSHPVFARQSRRLEKRGYRIASRFAQSTTFGGASWLAHMSVMTGVDCRNTIAWERLLKSSVRPLPSFFRERGYETVSVMPAMDIDRWPEGDYFQFSRHLWFKDIGYDGPPYAWSLVPDQFALLQLDRQVLRSSARPVFAEVSLTSSHAPFSVRPPFHRGAWTEEAMSETLASRKPRRNKAIWAIDPANYPKAIDYSIRSVTRYLIREYRREGVIVIIGDHQPPRTVHRAEKLSPATRFDVPMHVITTNEAVHSALLASGFVDGWFPDESAEAVPMHSLRELFLQALSHPANSSVAAR